MTVEFYKFQKKLVKKFRPKHYLIKESLNIIANEYIQLESKTLLKSLQKLWAAQQNHVSTKHAFLDQKMNTFKERIKRVEKKLDMPKSTRKFWTMEDGRLDEFIDFLIRHRDIITASGKKYKLIEVEK